MARARVCSMLEVALLRRENNLLLRNRIRMEFTKEGEIKRISRSSRQVTSAREARNESRDITKSLLLIKI